MSRNRMIVVTIGLMVSLFLASMESTVISTAMPTIVAHLGGIDAYSWVFAAYMLASTTTVPLFGKLSDVYGRRPVFMFAMATFLIGSLLCGIANSMGELIAYRVIQGLGAGGLLPLVFTIIGDMFSLKQRATMQGVFSGVWGVSSVVGPLLGGFLVDQVDWRWIFYVNIPPGLLAAAIVWRGWIDRPRDTNVIRPAVDYLGAALLTLAIVLLLLGLFQLGSPASAAMIIGALICSVVLIIVERRAADPIVPLRLFGDRLFVIACAQGLMAGCAMFGSVSFVPLFAQTVLGTSATGAGAVLMPLMLGWVFSSVIGGRLLLRFDYRTLAGIGMILLVIGALMLTQLSSNASLIGLLIPMALMGIGMGQAIPAFLIAVQSSVQRSDLGSATSTVQFSRTIGGAIGVSIMGLALTAQLNAQLLGAGIDPATLQLEALIDPIAREAGTADLAFGAAVVRAIAVAIESVFVIAFISAAIGLVLTLLSPAGRIGALRREGDPTAEPAKEPAASGQAS
ncbi:MAG TPA: MDR family MFS transporter [Roseiflexaceae bacterium]|nr:MDR family MFS transporter [Roseiflexaceae bacterium]HMP39221.1 MDR family MFS transporter [Roseiflexaceae bacterium]